MFSPDLAGVCAIQPDGTIIGWQLADYKQPSLATLAEYDSAVVAAWMDDYTARRSNLNCNYTKYVLYYLGQLGATRTYDVLLKDVCDAQYDGDGMIAFVNWRLSSAAPDPLDLMKYNYDDVAAWYRNNYELPQLVADYQFVRLSTDEIAAMRTDDSMIGYLVFNTTRRCAQRWTGVIWADLW